MRAPFLALAPLALLAGCGSADPAAVLETVHATEKAQLEAGDAPPDGSELFMGQVVDHTVFTASEL